MSYGGHTMSINQNTITFHDGRSAPRIGLGVWQVENDVAATVVQTALDIGYRSIDTAAIYGNEVGVGRGIAHSGVKREDLFVRSEEHTSELQSLMRLSYAVFCLLKHRHASPTHGTGKTRHEHV